MRMPGWGLAGVPLLLALLALAGAAAASVSWSDVTTAAGIDFRTAGEMGTGATGQWPAFPEITGSGGCWADVDGDGYDDLYLVNQVYNVANPNVDAAWATATDPHNQLYLNNGDGTFTDISAASGTDSRAWGQGCSAADYDGDGHVDLFVANFGDNELFHNNGDGTFTNVTAQSGMAMTGACGASPCWSTSSAWADYDRDGDVDLYVGNYVTSNATDLDRSPNGQAHFGQLNFLMRNNGDGTFTDVAQAAGAAGSTSNLAEGSKTLGVEWFDYDLDGDMDVLVANDNAYNNLYMNHGDGTFTDVAADANVDSQRSNMGITAADYDNDGYPDISVSHFQLEPIGFWWNAGDGTFIDYSNDFPDAQLVVGWGNRFSDVDRDGDKDLFQVNGHTEPTLGMDERRMLWIQDPGPEGSEPGDKEWTEVGDSSGDGMSALTAARGAAWTDYNFDGNVDFVVVNNHNETANLLEGSGATGHWLEIGLRQPGMNPDAIGARVKVVAGALTQYREVQAGASYASQDSLLLDFGLGDATQADSITVQWPTGGTTTVSNVPAGQVVRVDRATGTFVNDTLAPLTTPAFSATPSHGWFRGPVDVTLSAADKGVSFVSGVTATSFALEGGAWEAYTGQTFHFEDEGIHTLDFRSTDAAGNQEPPRHVVVRIDLTSPEVTHTLEGVVGDAGWYVSERVTVHLAASDAPSGVEVVRYHVDGGAWQVSDGSFDLTEDGVHAIAYEVTDLAGNAAGPFSFEVALDHTGPAVALQDPQWGAVYLGGQRLADTGHGPAIVIAEEPVQGMGGTLFGVAAASADPDSGLRSVTFLLDGATVAVDREGPDFAFVWDTATAASGVHTFEAVARDVAGNIRSDRVDVVLVSASQEGLDRTLGEGPGLPPALGSGTLVAVPSTATPVSLRATDAR